MNYTRYHSNENKKNVNINKILRNSIHNSIYWYRITQSCVKSKPTYKRIIYVQLSDSKTII